MSVRVGENAAPGPSVLIASWFEPSLSERLAERGLVVSLNQDVQVPVASGLMAERRVDRPSAVDPEINPDVIREVEQIQDRLNWHLRHLDTLASRLCCSPANRCRSLASLAYVFEHSCW